MDWLQRHTNGGEIEGGIRVLDWDGLVRNGQCGSVERTSSEKRGGKLRWCFGDEGERPGGTQRRDAGEGRGRHDVEDVRVLLT